MNDEKEYNRMIVNLQEENEEGFAELISKNFTLIYRYVNHSIKNSKLSLDLTMEIFLKMYYKILEYEYVDDFHFITWMIQIADKTIEYHLLNDKYELISQHTKLLIALDDCLNDLNQVKSCEEAKSFSNITQMVKIILTSLDEVEQFIIIKRFCSYASFKEIAKNLDKDESFVISTYNEIVNNLFENYGIELPKESIRVA